ncbi:glutaredoxin 3 [Siculibacillus lacustris]|uniref:Glutaredoxin n=1 Tax=Siculibacillus lacustris TaxID=1549641 RepID=A0A4Q9VYW3_9HYPH|nr:glutaredoxin 3 [Siculibacillus lacustris]TBW40433.1 glutaredoxin 3 [Siculibacillus lacustris]
MARPQVLIYTRDGCGYCVAAKRLLGAKGVAFEERNATATPAWRQEMIGRSGRTTFPQIFVGDTHVGGCDDLHALDARGGLDPLLAGGADPS